MFSFADVIMIITAMFPLSCIAEIERLGPQPMLEPLNSVGGWPVLDHFWDEGRVDLMHLMTDLALTGFHGVVKFEVRPNLTRSSQSVLMVIQ